MKQIFVFIAALFAAATMSAQQQPQPLPNDPDVRVGKLENGLTYYIRHNDKPEKRCEFYLASNVGAINEGPGQDGLAHFLEHMCFNGLKNLPGKQMLEYLQKIGCSFGGNINASTGVETTQYMLNNVPVVREGIIDTCLLIMHDYSHFVLNEEKEINSERGVILEEKRTRNNAGWRIFEKSMPYYYGNTKYATTNIIGSEETLKTFPREAIVDFYQTWYRPDKQAVIVVGDIDVDQIEAKIKALFADIPAPVNPKEMEPIFIPENEEPVVGVITDDEVPSNSYSILWRRTAVPEQFNNMDQVFLLDLVYDLFSMAINERLEDISSKPDAPFLSAAVGSENLMETCDAMGASVEFKNGQDIEALTAIMTEVERAKRYGVTAAELQRAKDNLLSSYEKAAQGADSRKNSEFIRPLISNFFDNTPFMTPQTRYDIAKMICSQLNETIINQLACPLFTDKNMVVLLVGPSSVEHPSEQQILDVVLASRKAEVSAPAVEETGLTLLDASRIKGSKVKTSSESISGSTEWVLKNGVRVVVLPTEYKKDEVMVKLVMDGGESLITDEELYSFEDNILGLYMQNSGLSSFSKSELNKLLAGKMVTVLPFFDRTQHGITATSTPKDLETALQLLYLEFTDPRFDENEYKIGIDQLNSMLPNLETNPMFQLQKRITSTVYSSSSRRFIVNADVLAKASLANTEKAYRRLFSSAAGASVYIVGNVDVESLKPLVEKYIGALPKGKKALGWEDDKVRMAEGKVIDHFTTPMTTPKASVFQIYSARMSATQENKLLLNALTYILNMVYTDSLREEEGGTYGASVYGDFERRPVEELVFNVYFDTNVAQAASLEALAVKGVKDLAENGPSDEFFARMVENFKNRQEQNRINNHYWMSILKSYYEEGVNKDESADALIASLTKEKIAAFAKAILDQGNFIEIEMGPAK